MLELAVHLPIRGSEDGDHQEESAQDLTAEGLRSLQNMIRKLEACGRGSSSQSEAKGVGPLPNKFN